MPMIAFSASIGPVPLDVVLRERHETSTGITENPVETGATVTDHAYMEPAEVSFEFADAGASGTWQALRQFQQRREPFTLVTGLDVYQNMLISRLNADRDGEHCSILKGTVVLREVQIVDTAYTASSGGDSREGASNRTSNGQRNASNSQGTPRGSDKAAGTVQRGDSVTRTVSPATAGVMPVGKWSGFQVTASGR